RLAHRRRLLVAERRAKQPNHRPPSRAHAPPAARIRAPTPRPRASFAGPRQKKIRKWRCAAASICAGRVRGDAMELLWISGIAGVCHRYEVVHRVAQARLLGARSTVRHFTDARLAHDVARADVVIVYRTPETPLVRRVLAWARDHGIPLLGTIDDLIFLPCEA